MLRPTFPTSRSTPPRHNREQLKLVFNKNIGIDWIVEETKRNRNKIIFQSIPHNQYLYYISATYILV